MRTTSRTIAMPGTLARGSAIVVALAACLSTSSACGGCSKKPDAPEGASPLDDVLASAKAARAEAPVDVLPPVDVVAASPDPMEYKRFADERPFFRALMATPLVEELRLSGPLLALEGLRHQIAGVARFVGAPNDGDALFVGPVAIGVRFVDDAEPRFVVAKRLDAQIAGVARFAASFADIARGATEALGQDAPLLSSKEVAGVTVRSVARGPVVVAFAFFKDLLVFGSDAQLVEQAVAIAAGEPGDVVPFVKGEGGRMLGARGAKGVHIAHIGRAPAPASTEGAASTEGKASTPEGDAARAPVAGLLGARALGVSLVLDPEAPLVVRMTRDDAALGETDTLLKYAPTSAFAVIADGRAPAAVVTPLLADVLDAVDAVAALRALADGLSPGVVAIAGALSPEESGADPAVVVVARHADRAAVEPRARALLDAVTPGALSRAVLDHAGGAVLFTSTTGPAIGVTDDAIVAGLDEARVRAALASGAAAAPRLVDRAALTGSAPVALGLYLDVTRAGAFAERFYASWAASDQGAPEGATATLAPTFAALRAGGHGAARLVDAKDGVFEGVFRVLP